MIAILIAAGIGVFIWGGYKPLYPDVGPYVGGKPLEPVNWDKLKASVIMKMAKPSDDYIIAAKAGAVLAVLFGFFLILRALGISS